MRLRHKFLFAPGLAALLLAGVAVMATVALRYQKNVMAEWIVHEIAHRSALLEIRADLGHLQAYLYRHITLAKAAVPSQELDMLRGEIQRQLISIQARNAALDQAVMQTSEDSADSLQAKFKRY